jgi:hypothetical protein
MMTTFPIIRGFGGLMLMSGLVAACGGSESSTGPTTTTTQPSVQPTHFLAAGLASPITVVNCTLSGGTPTTCYRIVTVGAPSEHAAGPWCPSNVSEGSVAGMWIESGQTYDLTGAFIANLATFYSDSGWKLFDSATGKIHVTDTQAAFEAAAVPNVAAAYHNYCVQGLMSYVGGGISRTILIPVTPVALSSGTGAIGMNGVGVTLNGIVMDAPAPVSNIKAAHTIAAFDDCGGHVNPHTGYHYHAATGCTTQVESSDGHAALIGYALDGYGIFALTDSNGAGPTNLDTCRGHSDNTRGYHYHVASAGANMFIGCFRGQQGTSS